MSKNQLFELLESAVTMAKHMPLVEDPRVHGAGEDGPVMAIGDLEIWPRGEPGARMARLADLTRVLEAQKQKMRKSLEAILEVADFIDDETGHQTRHIEEALNFSPKVGTIPQVLCHECGITSPAQMEVTGPFAWQADAARKAFCSMRCFDGWMRHYQDDLDEARASQSTGQAPTG